MCRRVQGSQIFKQNWIILIHSRVIVILPIWVSSALGGGAGGSGCLGWSAVGYMSSGMFRGKESSNRIELSRLVQDLLKFGVLGSLQLLGVGVGVWGWGWLGDAPYTCAHAHPCMHVHTHTCMVNMIISCKWPAPLGESLGIPYDVICMCTCVEAPSHHPPPTSTHPPPPRGGGDPWNQSKFNSTWTNQDISILFEDFKSVETSPPMGGWVGWWVGSLQITKNLKIVDWIKIIQFCLKIYDL